ncbi:MAG: hypothetical protein HY738_10375 [Bacteroidia bacterium]|nr:hypothetical protein [Bacteroidia bacterium]
MKKLTENLFYVFSFACIFGYANVFAQGQGQGQANFQFWSINGNGNITGNNYFGTSNSYDVIIKTNSFERFRITSNGDIIINPFT